MTVTFKLYASLTRYLPPGTNGHAIKVEITEKTHVQQLIDSYRITDEQAYLVMLNGIYIAPEQRNTTFLQNDDTLALWPKVAGG